MPSRASTSGVARALLKWAKTYEGLPRTLHLNASNERSGDVALLTGSAAVEKEYIDGSEDRRIDFTLSIMTDWSEGADEINVDAMDMGEEWLDWVAAQEDAKNYPSLPKGLEPLQIAVDDQAPTLSMAYEASGLAQYQFAAHLIYRAAKN